MTKQARLESDIRDARRELQRALEAGNDARARRASRELRALQAKRK